jgi:hypothetical protein
LLRGATAAGGPADLLRGASATGGPGTPSTPGTDEPAP